VIELTARLFHEYRRIVYIMPTGVVVRAIAPLIASKLKDPAVVVCDVGGRWAVSLLSGHEGGANDLAIEVGNALDAEPVITTTSEAVKTLIVGIGCRRGTSAQTLEDAIRKGLAMVNATVNEVRYLASADLKSDEKGLLEAAQRIGVPVRFISADAIRHTPLEFGESGFVRSKVNLPAVSEPSALLAGRKTTCILRKTIINGATIAISRENCWS
jgi:cobalt-precorrin 5A hydrolase